MKNGEIATIVIKLSSIIKSEIHYIIYGFEKNTLGHYLKIGSILKQLTMPKELKK